MSEVVDPLKYRSFGVKRPIEEKQEKLKLSSSILNNTKTRYYPIIRNGNETSVFSKAIPNVDEWGALIKHQSEIHETETKQRMLDK